MSIDDVNHSAIARFADQKVNLKRDDATELRRQANMLRDELASYLSENPDFDLKEDASIGQSCEGHGTQVD